MIRNLQHRRSERSRHSDRHRSGLGRHTLSLRIGLEGDINDQWSVFGGLGFEASPVSASRAEPGFPRGDAVVYAVGGSYNLPQLSFDVGYSFFDYDTLNASGQEFENPNIEGEYSGKEQVWSISARWRF